MDLVERVSSSTDESFDPVTELAVFGRSSPALIADEISRWCQQALGASLVDAWLWSVSVGCVAWVTLDDGRDVIIKAVPSDRTRVHVERMLSAQRAAAAHGLPDPSSCGEAAPLGLGWGYAEQA